MLNKMENTYRNTVFYNIIDMVMYYTVCICIWLSVLGQTTFVNFPHSPIQTAFCLSRQKLAHIHLAFSYSYLTSSLPVNSLLNTSEDRKMVFAYITERNNNEFYIMKKYTAIA